MLINIHNRNNDLLKDGKLDAQIIFDLEEYIEDRKRYQKQHLDEKVQGLSYHYEEWTSENQLKIKYAERLLECVKEQAKIETNEIDNKKIIASVDKEDNGIDIAVMISGEPMITLNISTDEEKVLIRKWIGFGDSEDDEIYLDELYEEDNEENW